MENRFERSSLLSLITLLLVFCWSCDYGPNPPGTAKPETEASATPVTTTAAPVSLPEPYATKSVTNFSKVIGWPADKAPTVPAGFAVARFGQGLVNPRNIYIAPNGDIFVAEANTELPTVEKLKYTAVGATKAGRTSDSANRITVFRDENGDGNPERQSVLLTNLKQPFGMAIIGNYFYVANSDSLWRYPYKEGDMTITAPGQKILDLPAGDVNRHWTRNILPAKNENKIYIAVGSGDNHGEKGLEHEVRRANILEVNTDGSGERIYASGLRNPVGMAFAPGSNVLWTAVNERDELGDDLVPDYLTGVKDGGFYGWPYSYFGSHLDPRVKEQKPDLVSKAVVPDMQLGSHTASLGLVFYEGSKFPEKYRGGAFIGQHGSWNRSQLSGYKVIFVPFAGGRPQGTAEDFLTGFITGNENEVFGRPVGVAVTRDGALLVADDAGNTIWRIRYE